MPYRRGPCWPSICQVDEIGHGAGHYWRGQEIRQQHPGFFSGACVPVERLLDDKVPLIVAGATTPDLAVHTSNLNFLALMAGWVAR